MLPFNPTQFIVDYPQFSTFSANNLTNIYNNQALILGSNVLALFNTIIPTSTWNASTNTPTLINGTGNNGQQYLCTVGGTVNFGAGSIVFVPYDIVQYNLPLAQWSNVGYPAQYYWSCVVLAHILQLLTTKQVGRVDSATEGSVTGSFTYDDSKNGAWWNQTVYGAECWQLFKKRMGSTYFGQPSYNGYPTNGVLNVGYFPGYTI